MSEEKIYVSNATNPLKKVMMCSPKYYTFNGINVITSEWMKKGDTEQNDIMVKEWQMLVDAYKDNGIEVVEVEANPKYEVMTFARDYGCMIKEGAVMGHFRHPVRQIEAQSYEAKLKEMGVPIVARVNAGCMEGGDFWMIDEHTLAWGMVDRTDEQGVASLRHQLEKFGYTVVGVPCPPDNLHLDMIFNIVAPQVALACIDQLPYNFLQMPLIKALGSMKKVHTLVTIMLSCPGHACAMLEHLRFFEWMRTQKAGIRRKHYDIFCATHIMKHTNNENVFRQVRASLKEENANAEKYKAYTFISQVAKEYDEVLNA